MRPAIGREHARAAVREVLEREEVFELRGVSLDDVGALRLELAQPVERAIEPTQPVKRVQRRVGDDAHARAAGPERYEPHPVTRSHQVIRAEPALTAGHARAPGRIVRPVVHLEPLRKTEPAGVGRVRDRTPQRQLPLQQTRASARIDNPSGGDACADHRRCRTQHRARVAKIDLDAPYSRRARWRQPRGRASAASSRDARDRAGTTAPAGRRWRRARRAWRYRGCPRAGRSIAGPSFGR